jgi:hypothetical protein
MDTDEKKPAAPYSDRFQKSTLSEQTSNISCHNPRQDELHRDTPQRAHSPTYALELRAEPGVNAIHALRAVLKNMLRRYGLRCISAHEIKDGDGQ